ncbi:MAG: MarR family transcriptional regulator [Deltaproteobacteria bacterium]|nr:MarR family transcriptional regulator [Deltaproteobacteria bacterium]HDM10329.1 MarR family transcriptional regulator [Desulfobacteraceae bacterium]
MNSVGSSSNGEFLKYQITKLQDLINQMVGCCEDKRLYQSRRFDLPYAELRCLMLFRTERYLTVKGIAQRLDVAKSRVTKLISGLVRKGLVESIEDPKDARVKLISLTRKGKEKCKEIEVFQLEIHEKILSQFDPEERGHIMRALENLTMAMETVKANLT